MEIMSNWQFYKASTPGGCSDFISNFQYVCMHVLHTSFFEAGKVNQRIDSQNVPMSRIIKVGKSIAYQAQQRSYDGRLHYMSLIPCFLTTFSCMKRKNIRKGEFFFFFCGSRSLDVNWFWT